jgi:hypothetical protein
MLTIFVSMALAQEPHNNCRITSEHPTVFASMTSVSIDGTVYPVAGSGARFAFETMLTDCGMSSAAYAFDRWRAKRRATNTIGISAGSASLIPILWPISIPVLIVTPFEAVAAGNRKGEMVAAISAHK